MSSLNIISKFLAAARYWKERRLVGIGLWLQSFSFLKTVLVFVWNFFRITADKYLKYPLHNYHGI